MVSTAIGPPDTTCGYTPSGFGLRGVGHYRAKHGRPGHGADERARRRHPPAPLHGEPGGRDRDALAGPLGARGHVPRAEPTGPFAEGFDRVADRPKLYVMDMFPYPSGAGLHVGHPLGYIGTDEIGRAHV